MKVVLAGIAVGILCGVFLGRWRGRRLGVSYGALATGTTWASFSLIAGNLTDGMGAIPHLVAGGVAFWFVAIPALLAVVVLEWQKAQEKPKSQSRG